MSSLPPRGVLLSCHGMQRLPPGCCTTRPLQGWGPKSDLSIGYRKATPLSLLKLFFRGQRTLSQSRIGTGEIGKGKSAVSTNSDQASTPGFEILRRF